MSETKTVASSIDIERGLPKTKTNSERLRDVDKKTLLFAGYIFWAVLFVAGGASAGVILSRKSPVTPAPTMVPSNTTAAPSMNPTDMSPTRAPTKAPTREPTRAPTRAPTMPPTVDPRCSNDEVMKELKSAFGEENCEGSWVGNSLSYKTECSVQSNLGFSASATYKTLQGSPMSLKVAYNSITETTSDDLDLTFAQDRCNLDKADGIFFKIKAIPSLSFPAF